MFTVALHCETCTEINVPKTVQERNSSPSCGWLKCCRVGPEWTEYQSELRRVLIDRKLVTTPIRECLPPPAAPMCTCLYQYRCVGQCVSVFTVPSAVLVISPLIGVCCIDSLVQRSDWHTDRQTEQVSRGKLVIGSAFCQSNCPLPLLPLCFYVTTRKNDGLDVELLYVARFGEPWNKTSPVGSCGYLCGCIAQNTIWWAPI